MPPCLSLIPLCALFTPVRDVPAGQIAIDVSFAGTPIYEEVDDLCSKTSCPIKTGPLDIKYIQDLPPIAPPVSASCLSRLNQESKVSQGQAVVTRVCCAVPAGSHTTSSRPGMGGVAPGSCSSVTAAVVGW
jgi:hypothetical protein